MRRFGDWKTIFLTRCSTLDSQKLYAAFLRLDFSQADDSVDFQDVVVVAAEIDLKQSPQFVVTCFGLGEGTNLRMKFRNVNLQSVLVS